MILKENETSNLICSDKVEGTAVFGPDNEKIGSIERVMIEKTSDRVSYAVLSFGGFLGIGDDHYPLPWHALKYDILLATRRLSDRRDHRTTPKCPEISGWERLGLGRAGANQDGRRLLCRQFLEGHRSPQPLSSARFIHSFKADMNERV